MTKRRKKEIMKKAKAIQRSIAIRVEAVLRDEATAPYQNKDGSLFQSFNVSRIDKQGKRSFVGRYTFHWNKP